MENSIMSDVTKLLDAWKEADKTWYTKDETRHYKVGRKYINLDRGTGGVFMVDKETREIFKIKAYGVPNKKKRVGILGFVTGEQLDALSRY